MSLDISELLKDKVLRTDDTLLKRKKEIKWLEDLFLSSCDKMMDFFSRLMYSFIFLIKFLKMAIKP